MTCSAQFLILYKLICIFRSDESQFSPLLHQELRDIDVLETLRPVSMIALFWAKCHIDDRSCSEKY